MTAGLTPAQVRSFAAFLRARYLEATVASTLVDVRTLARHADERSEPAERLAPAARRLLGWAANHDAHPALVTLARRLTAPRPRTTKSARRQRAIAAHKLALTDAQRKTLAETARVIAKREHDPAALALRRLILDGLAVSQLLGMPAGDALDPNGAPWADGVTVGEILAPRARRTVGAGGAYQRLRRAWPAILLAARERDASIPDTLTLRALERR